MLFHLLSENINIFRYLTFRSVFAAITGFLLVFLFSPPVIQFLKQMKLGQQVRIEGPSAHLIKTGTPTMGGILIWGASVFSTLLWGSWNFFIIIICLTVVFFAMIGFVDDYSKIKQKGTQGLSLQGKLVLQSIGALIILMLIYNIPEYHKTNDKLTLELVNSKSEVINSTNVTVVSNWNWRVSYTANTPKEDFYFFGKQYNPETGKTERQQLFSIPSLISGEEDIQEFSAVVVTNNGYRVVLKVKRVDQDGFGKPLREDTKYIAMTYKAQLFQSLFMPFYIEVLWYWPLWLAFFFYMFIIVGVSNATNLSDGLDGLATGMGISFYVPFGIFAYLMGNVVLSRYLFYPYIEGVGELSVFIAAAIGAFSGFLWYNVHPAEVFMGDTGSLPMGAAIATVAIMLKQELLLVIAGFMFALETVSVILQVFYYKKYKKRLFKMAPIHHHFELSGWKENQVVVRFWIMSAFCAILALASIKIR